MSNESQFTALILITSEKRVGLIESLLETLAPFSVYLLDMAEIAIRDRTILTLLISLNRDHAPAIEEDLLAFAERVGVDLAIDLQTFTQPTELAKRQYQIIAMGEKLSAQSLHSIASAITERSGHLSSPRKISTGTAIALQWRATLPTEFAGESELQSQMAEISRSEKISLTLAPLTLAHRRPRLLMLDVDSTLIAEEVIDLLAAKNGVGAEVAAITESAMLGELDFESSLRARVGKLAGASESILQQVQEEMTLTPGAERLIKGIKKMGGKVGIVSGGFTNVIEPLAKRLELDFYRANTLEILDGKITGQLLGEIVTREAKADALREFAKRESFAIEETIAIGDGANDIDMLQAAGLGIAFNAKAALVEIADTVLDLPNLDAVFLLLGISEDEN